METLAKHRLQMSPRERTFLDVFIRKLTGWKLDGNPHLAERLAEKDITREQVLEAVKRGVVGMVAGGQLRLTKASKMNAESAPVKAMQFALAHPEAPGLQIFHEGRCGRCGRVLTVPESVETGFGPECAGRLQ